MGDAWAVNDVGKRPPWDAEERPIKKISMDAYMQKWRDYHCCARWASEKHMPVDHIWSFEDDCWVSPFVEEVTA